MGSWAELPSEILQQILKILNVQSAYQRSPMCDCALVCKSWSLQTQHVLYKKLMLTTLPSLKKLNRTIEQNQHLANLIKNVESVIDEEHYIVEYDRALCELFTHGTYLERFNSYNIDPYIPIFKALIDKKLANLKMLSSPRYTNYDLVQYASCALLMKSRLKKLELLFTTNTDKDAIRYNRLLLDHLDQFEQLNELYVVKGTTENIVNDLNSAVDKCSSLRMLDFSYETDATGMSNIVSEGCISKPGIKCFRLRTIKIKSKNLLLYIMQKFPQLSEFYLSFAFESIVLDASTLKQFIGYICRIDKSTILNFRVNNCAIADTLGDYWEAKSKIGLEELTLNYALVPKNSSSTLLDLGSKGLTQVLFSEEAFLQSLDVLKRNGSSIKALLINNLSSSFTTKILELYLIQILSWCGNLQELCFSSCSFAKTDAQIANNDLSQKRGFKINQLRIAFTDVHESTFQALSKSLAHIEHLSLIQNEYINNTGDHIQQLNIEMINTGIGILYLNVLKDYVDLGNERRRNVYVKISTLLHPKEHYWKLDFERTEDFDFMPSSEIEYEDLVNSFDTHINICCRNLQTFEMTTVSGHTHKTPSQWSNE